MLPLIVLPLKTKENLWDFIFIPKCGLLLWLVRAQHDPITKANAKESLGN